MLIRLPATSANLGPGFDCFGIAWQCYDEIEFCPSDTVHIEGCAGEYRNENNLALRGWRAAFAAAGRRAENVRIRFGRTEIPVCRGLGSSAALSAGGAAAAAALFPLGLGRQGILDAAAAVEGHPDNAAPAIFGGLTASAMVDGRAKTVGFPVSEKLRFTALIPDFELSTALSRSVLPEKVSRGDAIFNVSRAALLLHAMGEGDLSLLAAAMEDRLHQPYRWGLIRGGERAAGLARDCGAAAVCISGAGPTLLCVAGEEDFPRKIREALAGALPGWTVRELPVERRGIAAAE